MTTETSLKKWQIDAAHSYIGFKVKHMLISNVKGRFERFDATAEGINSPESFLAEVKIDVDSISTNNTDRDNHLKSNDFFNANEYPQIIFKAISIKTEGNIKKVAGDLTIRSITKPVELELTGGDIVKDPYGNDRVGYTFKGEVNRFDYELTWNQLLEAGGAIVAPNVILEGEIEFITN